MLPDLEMQVKTYLDPARITSTRSLPTCGGTPLNRVGPFLAGNIWSGIISDLVLRRSSPGIRLGY
jgi:hypothetical protein